MYHTNFVVDKIGLVVSSSLFDRVCFRAVGYMLRRSTGTHFYYGTVAHITLNLNSGNIIKLLLLFV